MRKFLPFTLFSVVAVVALWLLWSGAARAATFQVSPTRFEFSLERRFTDFFSITNNAGTELRLRISTTYVELDAGGNPVARTGSPYDLTPWIVVNPRRITMGPGEKRVVRFTVRPPSGLKDGEYRTVVFFEEQPPRPDEHKPENSGVQIRVLTRLGITIYGRIGQPAPDLKLDTPSVTVAAERVDVHATVRNVGTARATLDLAAAFLDSGGTAHGDVKERLLVQREQVLPIDLRMPRPPPGSYRLQLKGQVEDQTVIEAEFPFTVPPAAQ